MGLVSDTYAIINQTLEVGEICKSNKDGLFIITDFVSTGDGKKVIIEFEGSGNTYTVTRDSVKRGLVQDNKKDRTPAFIEQCRRIHGDKYSYENTAFKSVKDRVSVNCKIHGDITVTASVLLAGGGCKKCAMEKVAGANALSKYEFAKKVNEVHKGRIIPLLDSFTKTANKATFFCPIHGKFETNANSVLQGTGCRKCAFAASTIARTSPVDEVIRKANEIHGGKYTYLPETYKTTNGYMDIICPEHGKWTQAVRHHLNGVGCPICSPGGFRTSKPGVLYILKAEDWIKVGISNHSASARIKSINKSSPRKFTEVTSYVLDGLACQRSEANMLKWLRDSAKPVLERFEGYSETFYDISLASVINKLEEVING